MAYNLETVRKLLDEAFDSEEISNMARDRFHTIHADFTAGMSKSRMINMIVTYAQKNDCMPALFEYIQENNPYYYAEYADRL